MRFRRRSRRALVVIGVLVVLLGASVYGYTRRSGSRHPSRNAAQPPSYVAELQSYVDRYIQLVNAGDEHGLRTLLANAGHPGDAALRIDAYRNLGLRDPQVSATKEDGMFTDPPIAYGVIISATTSAGKTVKMQELITWTNDPLPGARTRTWHWVMSNLHSPVYALAGVWSEATTMGDYSLQIHDVSRFPLGYRFRATGNRLLASPEEFTTEAGSIADSVPGRWVIRCVSKSASATPDVLVYDYLSDSITITTGSTKTSYTLVRVSGP